MRVTFGRVLLVTGLLASVGIAQVRIRQEMAACSHRIQKLHQQQVRLQQDLWTRQMDLARLRVPERLRERVDLLGISLEAPRAERRAARSAQAGGRGIIRTSD